MSGYAPLCGDDRRQCGETKGDQAPGNCVAGDVRRSSFCGDSGRLVWRVAAYNGILAGIDSGIEPDYRNDLGATPGLVLGERENCKEVHGCARTRQST